MVEATEFPQLSYKYGVMGVPKTIVNEKPAADGMLPEQQYLEAILSALEKKGT